MNTTRLSQARRLFFCDGVPASTARHNARQWTRSVRFLGARWHVLQQQPKAPSTVTLGQLRERLQKIRGTPWGAKLVSETETIADRIELEIAEREIAAGLRPAVRGESCWGPL